MKHAILMATVWMLWAAIPAPAAPSCDELARTMRPQSTPAATFQLELDMMQQGFYCYDLPLFDPAWRQKSQTISLSRKYTSTAQRFRSGYKVNRSGRYAIIYYPDDATLGPVFLYNEGEGWVIDRTAVYRHIRYGNTWHAAAGDYPYLKLLHDVFDLEPGTSSRGQQVFRIRKI